MGCSRLESVARDRFRARRSVAAGACTPANARNDGTVIQASAVAPSTPRPGIRGDDHLRRGWPHRSSRTLASFEIRRQRRGAPRARAGAGSIRSALPFRAATIPRRPGATDGYLWASQVPSPPPPVAAATIAPCARATAEEPWPAIYRSASNRSTMRWVRVRVRVIRFRPSAVGPAFRGRLAGRTSCISLP